MREDEFQKRLTKLSSRKPPSSISTSAKSEDFSDEHKYNFGHQYRGLALIICNINFKNEKDCRGGAEHDGSALDKSFKHLGFDVELFKDLTAEQMHLVAQKAATKYDHGDVDCFAFAVSTHGGENEIAGKDNTTVKNHQLIGVDGEPVITGDIVDCFNDENCPSLIGKPRMFFIQACRGHLLDDGVKYENLGNEQPIDRRDRDINRGIGESGDAVPMDSISEASGDNVTIRPAILYPDFLIMYASPPGYRAWRGQTGSWFIQELCKVLDSDAIGSKSLQRGLTTVCRKVALKYESCTWDPKNATHLTQEEKKKRIESDKKKGMPVVNSLLLKDVYMVRK